MRFYYNPQNICNETQALSSGMLLGIAETIAREVSARVKNCMNIEQAKK